MSTSFRRWFFPWALLLLALTGATVSGRPLHANPGEWAPLGPGSGSGSDTGCVALHPGSPGAVWACLPQGGLYKSADRGATWRWAGSPFTGYWAGLPAVTADPARPGALWAATSSGVFRTEDGGLTWRLRSDNTYTSVLGEAAPFAMVSLPGALYVVTTRRLLVSGDGGVTWEARFADDPFRISTFATNAAHPETLFLAGTGPAGAFFLRSQDGGNTWEDLTDRLFPETGIGRLAATASALYASIGEPVSRLFRSTDGGISWRDLRVGGPGEPIRVGAWTLDLRAPRTLYAYGTGEGGPSEPALWVSNNAGNTWRKAGIPPFAPQLLAADTGGGALYAANFEGLARSVDGGAIWKTVLRVPNRESPCAQISFLPDDPSRLDLTVGFTAWRSTNQGRTWALTGSPRITDIDAAPDDPTRMVAVAGSSAYLSENAGKTWRKTSSTLWYAELLVRVDARTLLAAGAGLYRSADNGETWQAVLPAWMAGSDTGRWVQKVEVDPGDPSRIWALTFLVNDMELPHGILADYPSNLWKSEDGGATWKKVARNLRAFAFDRGAARLLGVRNRDVLASGDGGRSWTKVARTPYLVQDLVIDPTDSHVLYLADPLSAWRSTNGGASWQRLGGEREIYALTLNPADPRKLYAADRWGIWEMTVPVP